jgi:hypothetical protein
MRRGEMAIAEPAFDGPPWAHQFSDKTVLGKVCTLLVAAHLEPGKDWALVSRSLFLNGHTIGNEELFRLMDTLYDLERPRPANVIIIKDLTALSFEEQTKLRRRLHRVGGTLTRCNPGVEFADSVQEHGASLHDIAAQVAQVKRGPRPTLSAALPPPSELYAPFAASDEDFHKFIDALANDDDSESVAS